MSHQQTDAELVGHLADQVAFLRRSGDAYDQGDDAEAKRLAVAVRTLCHDTARSRILLTQLGLLDNLRFVDTAWKPPSKREPEPAEGTMTITVFSSPLAPMAGGRRGFAAELDHAIRSEPKRFEDWWSAMVLEVPEVLLRRRDIVLALSNKDGGAHVDPEIGDGAYLAVSRQGGLGEIGYTVAGETHASTMNPALAVMRQIAFEVEESLVPIVGRKRETGEPGR